MKNLYTKFLFAACAINLCHIQQSFASHTMGADISYRYVAPNQYEVTLAFYRNCSGSSNPGGCNYQFGAGCSVGSSSCIAPGTVYFYYLSANCGFCLKDSFDTPYSVIEVTPICPSAASVCNGGSNPGVEQWIYKKVVTLPAQCTDWRFVYGNFARNNSITTLTTTTVGMYVQATLNSVLAPTNSSPAFLNPPVPWVCMGQSFCYSHGAVEPDGDSLVYTLTDPLININNGTVSYMAPFSATAPLSSAPPLVIYSHSGLICFTPTAVEVTVMAVRILEYRNGVVIGSTVRDMQVTVLNCANSTPELTGMNGTPVFADSVCAGNTLCFTVDGSDINPTDTLNMSWNSGISGATFVVTNNNSFAPQGQFCWTPTLADVRSAPYAFSVTVRDNACPYVGTQSYPFLIYVTNCGTAIPVANFIASDTVICGTECVDYTDMSINATSWSWTFTGGNPSSSTQQSPQNICYAASGLYAVTLIAGNGTTYDTMTVSNYITVYAAPPAPAFTQVGDTLFVQNIYASYQWYFSSDTIFGATNYFYVATQSGNYNISVMDDNGCVVGAGILNVIAATKDLAIGNMQLAIYPNPAKDYFGFRISDFGMGTIEIYNSIGEKVYHVTLREVEAQHTLRINTVEFSRGIYLLKITAGEKIITEKIVVEKN